jgi:phosphoribosylanthranilate isomerase
VVKICGLREPNHAVAAVEAGADLIGFIFAPARRQVTASIARACITAAREAGSGRHFLAVGVFVDADPLEASSMADAAGLDVLQLHGQEPPESLASLNRPVIKALRPRPGDQLVDVAAALSRYRSATVEPRSFLLDGYSASVLGGSGHRADWQLAGAVCAMHPVILGGGLDALNAHEAIRAVRPLGVDVSSGVETEGRKDPEKIAAFVTAARAAFKGS